MQAQFCLYFIWKQCIRNPHVVTILQAQIMYESQPIFDVCYLFYFVQTLPSYCSLNVCCHITNIFTLVTCPVFVQNNITSHYVHEDTWNIYNHLKNY
jgi:hypothetical protein